MKIGIIIPEVGGLSALALEFKKWYVRMVSLGYTPYILTGRSRETFTHTTVMPDLFHENSYNYSLISQLFELTDNHADELDAFVEQATRIQQMVAEWINNHDVAIIIIEQFFSVPVNIPVSYALYNFFEKNNCKKIVKHHDMFKCDHVATIIPSVFMQEVFKRCFPINMPQTYHVSTNRIIKQYLQKSCGIDSVIIPYIIEPDVAIRAPDIGDLALSHDFYMRQSDNVFVHFNDLMPSSSMELVIGLLNHIHDDRFKIVVIGRKHKAYDTYISEINERVIAHGLQQRCLILLEDDVLSKSRYGIDDVFYLAKGVVSVDMASGFGQPLHMAIQHKCGLLVCTESQLDWFELAEVGIDAIHVSNEFNHGDVMCINQSLWDHVPNRAEANYNCIQSTYSGTFLRHALNTFLNHVQTG
jgi:hypothetical protein